MPAALRQRWDTVNDRPSLAPVSKAVEFAAHEKAMSREIPEYRGKLVTLPGGQYEVSVTPANSHSVMNARMSFNPLLDCARKEREPAEQEARVIENRERSVKRATQNIRYGVKAIFADHLLTFTYRETVLDRARVARDWQEFNRLFSKRHPEWEYRAVLEKCDSEKTAESHRGTLHIHVAVAGRQDIKWLRRCWLLAIGQSKEDVSAWLNNGKALLEKSLGSVNVNAPKSKYGKISVWRRNKLAGYLTKYLGKEFEEGEKGAKKYWGSKLKDKPVIKRFWLKSRDYWDALKEALKLLQDRGAKGIKIFSDEVAGVVWITGEVPKDKLSWEHCNQLESFFDLNE
jgi:hypothetical protein